MLYLFILHAYVYVITGIQSCLMNAGARSQIRQVKCLFGCTWSIVIFQYSLLTYVIFQFCRYSAVIVHIVAFVFTVGGYPDNES